MADEAGETNTAVEDGEAKQQPHEPQVPAAATDDEDAAGGSDAPDRKTAATEGSWSAPILSLARKATETISSGVSLGAAPRTPAPGSAVSSPTEETHIDLNNTSKKLPGRL